MSSPRPPISPRLLDQLARTLRAVEGARQAPPAERDRSLTDALDDLGELSRQVETAASGSIPDGIPDRLAAAREALEAERVEAAREALIGVGRAIDEFLKAEGPRGVRSDSRRRSGGEER